MRKILIITTALLIVSSVFGYYSCVKNIDIRDNEAAVSVVVDLSRRVEMEDDISFSGTVYTITMKGCYESFSMVPVRSGPLDFVSLYSLNGNTFLSFHMIIPSRPIVTTKGNTLVVTFLKSRNRFDYSFSENMTLKEIVKYLAESLNVNIVISNDAVNLKVPSLKLDNSTPEDALRTLIMAMNLYYTYFPNGTMYIAKSQEEIKKKLLEFWGSDSEEAIIQEIRSGFLRNISNKSIISMSGTPESLKKIFQALAEKKIKEKSYEFLTVYDKDAAANLINSMMGDKIKVFTGLPGKSIVIYGENTELKRAERLLRNSGLLSSGSSGKQSLTYEIISVSDTKSAKDVIESLFPELKTVEIPNSRLILYGSKPSIESAKNLLLRIGLLGHLKAEKKSEAITNYEILDIKDAEGVAKALSLIFGNRIRSSYINGKLILVGPNETLKEAKSVIEKFVSESKEKETTDIITISNPEDKAKILSGIFPDLKIIPGKSGLVIKGTKSRIKEAEKFLEKLDKIYINKNEVFKIVAVQDLGKASSILTKVFENLKVVPIDEKQVLLIGKESDVEAAISLLKKIVPSKKEENIIMKILNVSGVSQDELIAAKKIESYVSGVELFKIPKSDKLVIFGKSESAVTKAFEMVEKILSGVSKPISVKDGKITVRSDNMPLGDIVKEVLEDMGKSVVVMDEISTPVSLYLNEVSFEDFLSVLKKFGVEVKRSGDIYYIHKSKIKEMVKEKEKIIPPISESMPSSTTTISATPEHKTEERELEKLSITENGSKVKLSSSSATLREIIEALAKKFSRSVVFVDSPDIPVTLNLENVDFDSFSDIVRNFGYDIEKVGDVYYVKKSVERITTPSTSTESLLDIRFKSGKAYINVENIPLSQLVKKLSEGFKKSIVFVDTPSENITLNVQGMEFKDMKDILGKFGYELEKVDDIYYLTKIGKSIVAKIAYGFDKLKELVGNVGGNMFYDNSTGMVIIRNLNTGAYELVKNFIAMLKKSPPQVAIQVKIIEESANENTGSQASLNLTAPDGNLILNNSGLTIKTKVLSATDYEEYLRGLLGGDLDVKVGGVKANGKSKILASPNVTTMNGKKAVIEIGGQKIFVTSDGTRLVYPIGVKLEITPYVRADNKIDLLVNVSISDVLGSPPEITQNKRSATTRVVIDNGQTLVIGGLMKQSDSKSVEKLPILGDLPIIGWLFRKETVSKETKNLVIFITAKVVGK